MSLSNRSTYEDKINHDINSEHPIHSISMSFFDPSQKHTDPIQTQDKNWGTHTCNSMRRVQTQTSIEQFRNVAIPRHRQLPLRGSEE